MALKLRRGTNAERLTVTPEQGELIYTTDTKRLFVGDGSTAGGTVVTGINNIAEDTSPQLGGDLDLNGNNITGSGNINITGTITATGNINLGDGTGGDIISVAGSVSGSLEPDQTNSYNIGTTSKRWLDGFFSSVDVTGEIRAGSLRVDDIMDLGSTIIYDSSQGKFIGDLEGDVTSALVNTNAIESSNTGDINNKVVKIFQYTDTTNTSATIEYNRGKNTEASPTVVSNNNHLGRTDYKGYDGSDFQLAAQIVGAVRGTVSPGAVPGKLMFFAANEAGTLNKIAEARGEDLAFVITNTLDVDGIFKSNGGADFRAGLSGDLTGSVFGDDSTLLVDGVNSIVPKAVVEDSANWDAAHAWGNHAMAGYQSATAPFTGDVNGSVFSDNSTLLIDAVNGAISVANADLVGTEDDGSGVDVAGGVTGYLQVTVNGANKFIPLYDPA